VVVLQYVLSNLLLWKRVLLTKLVGQDIATLQVGSVRTLKSEGTEEEIAELSTLDFMNG
jgi:hypothetical protein